jgi:hypothetical protein
MCLFDYVQVVKLGECDGALRGGLLNGRMENGKSKGMDEDCLNGSEWVSGWEKGRKALQMNGIGLDTCVWGGKATSLTWIWSSEIEEGYHDLWVWLFSEEISWIFSHLPCVCYRNLRLGNEEKNNLCQIQEAMFRAIFQMFFFSN